MTIKLTAAAVKQIQASARESGIERAILRIAAQRGADGGIEYAMGYDDEAESDTTSEYDNLTVLVAPTSIDLLSGAVLDFIEIEGQMQFVFLNPNDPAYVPPEIE
ncbi:MAG: hypothetical protein DHS20C01_19670 [marine bacterium B5-7]|nr:MAG: hypothetical protein DHS20C01_19670 [marine bacterium B5-7]